MFNNPNDETRAIAKEIFLSVHRQATIIARLEEREKFLSGELAHIEDEVAALSDVVLRLQADVRDLKNAESDKQKRADMVAEKTYGMIFGWIQTFVPWVCIGVLTWLLTHRQPSPTPQQPQSQGTKKPAIEQGVSGASEIYP